MTDEVIDGELLDTAECTAVERGENGEDVYHDRCVHVRCLLRERNRLRGELERLKAPPAAPALEAALGEAVDAYRQAVLATVTSTSPQAFREAFHAEDAAHAAVLALWAEREREREHAEDVREAHKTAQAGWRGHAQRERERLAAATRRAEEAERAQPESEWHEDVGPVLWWAFPVQEPPYVGTPLDSDWPGYHTHWTPLAVPTAPAAPGAARVPTPEAAGDDLDRIRRASESVQDVADLRAALAAERARADSNEAANAESCRTAWALRDALAAATRRAEEAERALESARKTLAWAAGKTEAVSDYMAGRVRDVSLLKSVAGICGELTVAEIAADNALRAPRTPTPATEGD
jgi:hypothetical protein